jgi:predicted metal-dependent phosphoesterase TrpH
MDEPTRPKRLTCDLHAHTCYSRDSLTSLTDFLAACRRKGLERVAVTDHGTIDGALRLQEMDPQRIIVGQEIYTTEGELIACFLTRPVPSGCTPQQAIEQVHAQGGLVGVSHPLDRLRREALGRKGVVAILDQLDFLEAFNARCVFPADNRAARELALAAGLPMTAGSDAHTLWELGRGTVQMAPFDSPLSFLTSLRTAQIDGQRSPMWVHFFSSYARLARRWGLSPQASGQ